MSLANKSFRDNKTGEIVKVIDVFENIAILESKEKADVRRLMDPNFYTEQIDVNNFFNNQNAYNHLAEKIKNIPTENIVDDDGKRNSVVIADGVRMPSSEESAVILSDPEDERAELARKYGVENSNESLQNQNQAFAKILGDDNELPKVAERKTEVVVNGNPQVQVSKTIHQPASQNDPITNMFKNVKRNISFKMNLEVSNKIPRLDFIEMMEDSYEVSIIDYLAEEFTQNLLKNPSQIKEMIKDRIKMVVYGADRNEETKKDQKPVVKKAPAKSATKKTSKKPDTKKEEVK